MKSACGFDRPFFDRAVDEARALRVHLGADLLAHGAAQHIGFAERVTGQLLRDLHHLFLVDDDALRLLHQMIDLRMDRGDLLLPVLARIVGRDVLHRTGAIERDQRDDVLDAVGLHADQRLAHARTFHLEDADHLAARQHGVGLRVVERDARQVDLDAAPADQFHRAYRAR